MWLASRADAFNRRGIVYKKKGQYDRTIPDYDQAIWLNPKNPGALNNRGIAKLKKGDFVGGNADIARAKQLSPSVGN